MDWLPKATEVSGTKRRTKMSVATTIFEHLS